MSRYLLLKQGTIHNAIEEEPYVADILVENGKIKKIVSVKDDRDMMMLKSSMLWGLIYIRGLWVPIVIWGWTDLLLRH